MSEHLPAPDTDALTSSQALCCLIRADIEQHRGWIPFSRFMQLALYAPQYGYYGGGAHKFGAQGDFVTAPTLTPLFGQTLAIQINALLPQTAGVVYEFGAGNGALATTLLQALDSDALHQYCIVEVSAELAARQRDYIARHIPQAMHKVTHLSALPDSLDGVVLGNEVLDAMPIEVVRWHQQQYWHMGVAWQADGFIWQAQPLTDPALLATTVRTLPNTADDYTSELHLQQQAFISTLAQKLARGAIILIDYGFNAQQYYHPQRNCGTLIGHYRHHSVHDVFFYPGLTDLTAHVNFTAIAEAAVHNKLDLIGYTTQAHFLLNLGITELLANLAKPTNPTYIQAASACQILLSQHEMGELFKVMALGKNIDVDWQGFTTGDICHKL